MNNIASTITILGADHVVANGLSPLKNPNGNYHGITFKKMKLTPHIFNQT
jgi:hypothetical protein